MRRLPVASPHLSSKVADWSRAGLGQSASLSALPSEDASPSVSSSRAVSRTQDAKPRRMRAVSEASRAGGQIASERDSQSPKKVRPKSCTMSPRQSPDGAFHPLVAQEECCATILRKIFPSTQSGIAFFSPKASQRMGNMGGTPHIQIVPEAEENAYSDSK